MLNACAEMTGIVMNGDSEANNTNGKELMDESLNNLMEKIRRKSNQYKSWNEIVKLARNALFEKRHIIVNDANEKSQIQKCLDTIQKSIKIVSLQSMIERLESITRQLGLKFTSGPLGKDVFISSDMFYVEVVLEPSSGYVIDVKIAHQTDPLSCPELTVVLRNADFIEFTKHLDGLSAIYQLNADKKQKTKAYLALHALETDLSTLAQLQSSFTDPNNLVHKTPVGILEPRKGGHPMKLTYFISPYDLLDINTKASIPFTVDVVIKNKLGYSATVCIESSSNHKLQTTSLISVTKTTEGKSLPQFAALSNLNSSTLPACFVLRLPKELPISIETLFKIASITGTEVVSAEMLSKAEPIANLIAKSMLPKKDIKDMQSYHGPYYVKLPDQHHCYYMNNTLGRMEALEITSIPFTHPTHVPQILVFLRQQVLFNVVIGSCIRQLKKCDSSSYMMFEVTALSMTSVNVTFEHPLEESLATVDFDLKDITNTKCKLYDSSSFASLCSDDYASKVMQRCLSIPVTMRSIIRKCQEKAAQIKEEMQKQQQSKLLQQLNQNDLYFNSMNSNGNRSQQDSISSYLSQQLLSTNQFHENMNNSTEMASNAQFQHHQQQQQQHHVQQQYSMQYNPQLQSNNLGNMMFQQDQQPPRQQIQMPQQKPNAMLMSMLSDIPAANSQQIQQFNSFNQQQQLQQQLVGKPKKTRKRKGTTDGGNIRSPGSSTGRSPKRKMSEDDYSRDLPTPGSDFMEQVGDISRPPSTASSSTPSYDTSIANTPRSLESMLSGVKQEQGANTMQSQNMNLSELPPDLMANYQYMSRSVSFPLPNNQQQSTENELNDLPDLSGFDLSSIDVANVPQAKQGNKRGPKRMKSAEACGDGSLISSQTSDDGSNEQQMILKSLEDLHQSDLLGGFGNPGKPFSVPAAKSPRQGKSPSGNGSDGRRCSSAGIEGVSMSNKRGGFGSALEDVSTVTLKKERKRKRAESVDSIKTMALPAAASITLMPPPMITSTGEITATGGGNAYSFMDVGSNGVAPALRPITLNVKPMLPSSATNGPIGKSISSKKTSLDNSITSSDAGNQKMISNKFVEKGLKSPKGLSTKGETESNGNASSLSPKSSPKLASSLKSCKVTKNLSGNNPIRGIGLKQQSMKYRSSNMPSSSSGIVISKPNSNLMTSPPVSSSSSKHSQQNSKGLVQKRKQVPDKSLTAVIDKLRGNAGAVSNEDASITVESGKIDSRPDSSSGKNNGSSGVSSSANRLSESKVKYSRSSDHQFTLKQGSPGALKLTVTKTKPSSAMPELKSKSKLLSSGLSHKGQATSSSPGNVKSSKVSGSGLKRQMGSSLFKPGFKGSVSSSSSLTINGPKPSSSSTSPKSGTAASSGRNMSNTKVSSSNASGNGKNKITSTGFAILDAAIPRIRIDHLPKIPRTSNSQANNNNNNNSTNNNNNQSSQSSQPSSTAISPGSSSSSSTNNYQQNQFRKNFNQRESVTPTTTSETASKFQSSAVSSSVQSQQPQMDVSSVVTSTGITENETKTVDSTENNPTPIIAEQSSVSSSSDARCATTSTPSSPVECSTMSDGFQKPPTLIPTELIEDLDKEEAIESANKVSSELHLKRQDSSSNIVTTSSVEISSRETPKSTTEEVPHADDVDDDEEGLVIDFLPTPGQQRKNGNGNSSEAITSSNSSSEQCLQIASKSPTPTVISSANISSAPISTSVNHSPSNQSGSSSSSRPSPYLIDDDLMDEALVGGGE